MSLLDDKMIDYYDSEKEVKVPKQNSMKERLQEDFWEEGTQSRQRRQQPSKENSILSGNMRQKDSETHSLTYIYSGLSKPVSYPGIHEFTAMGLLDDKMIDYYDSETQVKVPKQDWMKERLPADYWETGTKSRQRKQQWFKENTDTLMKRMRQNDSDIHVLQRRVGCEGDRQDDGSITFKRGIDKYNYDGSDFLSFDNDNSVWVASVDAAIPTKRKWDGDLELKEKTKGYLEHECTQWLENFLHYEQKHLKEVSKPEVFFYPTKSKEESNVLLNCLATGFYPKHINMELKQNGRVLSELDGLQTTGVRPNGDDTFQRRDYVEILKYDVSNYSCQITHKASDIDIEKDWKAGGSNTGVIIGAVIAGPLIIVGVAVLLFILWKKGCLDGARDGDGDITGGPSSIVNNESSTVITMPDKSPANEDDDRASSCSKDDGRASSCSGISDYVKYCNVSLDGSDSGVSSGRRESQTPEAESLLNNS